MSFSASLVEQAWYWKRWANFVHIAVPKYRLRGKRESSGSRVLRAFCRDKGIGGMSAKTDFYDGEWVSAIAHDWGANFQRNVPSTLREALHPGMKRVGVAGSQGTYWTPWKEMCHSWLHHVKKNPGCTIKEVIETGHTYASDASCRANMVQHIEAGRVPGIRCEKMGRQWLLFPTEVEEQGAK